MEIKGPRVDFELIALKSTLKSTLKIYSKNLL